MSIAPALGLTCKGAQLEHESTYFPGDLLETHIDKYLYL